VLHHRDRIEAADGIVLAIGFDSPERMLSGLDFPWPVLLDRERVAYRRYGLGRAPLTDVLTLGWLPGFLRKLLGGDPLKRPGLDVLQLGGDFVVDRDGTVVLAHPSEHFEDREPTGALVSAMEASA
jgi:hypothetical protein